MQLFTGKHRVSGGHAGAASVAVLKRNGQRARKKTATLVKISGIYPKFTWEFLLNFLWHVSSKSLHILKWKIANNNLDLKFSLYKIRT